MTIKIINFQEWNCGLNSDTDYFVPFRNRQITHKIIDLDGKLDHFLSLSQSSFLPSLVTW